MIGFLALAGCTGDAPSAVDDDGNRGTVAGTDTSQRSVELADVVFDTFGNGPATLADADEDQIVGLRDAIPPLHEPPYDPIAGGTWLEPDDLLLVYVSPDGNAFGYPHKILNFHEIVNDTLDGVEMLASYCPLCGSGVVYSRVVDGRTLRFGNTSALYENDLVMYDDDTFSYWWQVAGEAIVGDLTGERLEPLPAETLTWDEFASRYPDGRVLSKDTGSGRDYEVDPFSRLDSRERDYQARVDDGQFPFPVSDEVRDRSLAVLSPGARVIGVEIDGVSRAYAAETFAGSIINDQVAGVDLVVVAAADGRGGSVFRAEARGRPLTFSVDGTELVDAETGSRWTKSGRAVAGELAGEQLALLASRSSFWFAFVAAFPDADAVEAPG